MNKRNDLGGVAEAARVLAVLVALAALAAGLILGLHSVPAFHVNPYDPTLIERSGNHYPFAWAGVGIALGGLVQAVLFWMVARVATVVSRGPVPGSVEPVQPTPAP